MKIAIVGSRNFTDYVKFIAEVENILYNELDRYDNYEIVSGGARGTDSMAKAMAKTLRMGYKEFSADWDTYGKRAGYIRNKEIAGYSEICIAFLLGASRGTKITIKEFEKLDKLVFKVEVD